MVIPASHLNVETDVAVCEKCNDAFSISALLASGQVPDDFNIHDPPRGAWFEDTGTGCRLGATTRSPTALLLVPFMCVWSGFSLGGIYGTQIVNGEFSLGMSLFGIPFVLGTLLFGSIAFMTVCGKVVVVADGDDGRVFQGVGPIGWTRRFDWASMSSVEEAFPSWHHSGSIVKVISLVGQTRLSFGSMLSDPRRYYLLQCLRKFLADRSR
ncbi:MAG: hypothetical protein L0Y72_24105 [Gemmataceae bacterium]|nr:hypothetical protein [Gemmataceae bacterium]MCI0742130.1 hypothetical protein [Gemmataceae bacterium]